MTDIRKLIEAVEAGDLALVNSQLGVMFRDDYDRWPWDIISLVNSAYNGSLDAAKALHEAILESGFHAEIWACCTRPRVKVVRTDEEYDGHEQDTEARSWLLSILKAYEAQQ